MKPRSFYLSTVSADKTAVDSTRKLFSANSLFYVKTYFVCLTALVDFGYLILLALL